MNILSSIKWYFMSDESKCKRFIESTIVNQMNSDNPFEETTLVFYDVLDVSNGYVKFSTRYSDMPFRVPRVESESCHWFIFKLNNRMRGNTHVNKRGL